GRRRHTSFSRDWSSDVCSSDLLAFPAGATLLAAGLWRTPCWRRLALASLAAGVAVVLCGFLASGWIGAALVQRAAFLAWLGWGVLAAAAGRGLSRGAA